MPLSSIEQIGTPIPLVELPRWSPWPARLLGLAPWSIPSRTVEKVEQEYNVEKYGSLLQWQASHPGASPDEVKAAELGADPESEICVSSRRVLYRTALRRAYQAYADLLAERLEPWLKQCASVVELGSGYGYQLWKLRQRFPRPRYVGGEFSGNAVELARRLYDGSANSLAVVRFNYYEASTYDLLQRAEAPVVVFTSHSIEQLPSAAGLIGHLARYRERIARVLHFEPLPPAESDDLLSLLRRRYAEVNDYSRDLLTELQRNRERVRILAQEEDVLGVNPLNPTSILEWEFT